MYYIQILKIVLEKFLRKTFFYQKLAKKFLFIFKNKKYDKYIVPVGNNYQWAICKIVLEYLKIDYISIEGSVNFLDKKILLLKSSCTQLRLRYDFK